MSKKSKSSVFAGLGSSSHSLTDRAKHDFYVTDPLSIELLHKYELLDVKDHYWECACGNGALSKKLIELGYDVNRSTDLYDHGYGESGIDFLKETKKFNGSIITNPPFNLMNEFIIHGLELSSNKLFIFGRIQTIESYTRYDKIFRDNPPSYICVFVKRIHCYNMGDAPKTPPAICYAWFIWDSHDNSKECKIKWLY